MNARDILMIYIAVGVLVLFLYGILIGTDNVEVEDFGIVLFLSLTWPIFIIPFLGVAIGSALKEREVL